MREFQGRDRAQNNKRQKTEKVELLNNKTDIKVAVDCCRDEIQKSIDTGIMPAPKYFEQAAVLSRKEKNYQNEIAICDMYIKLVKKYASEHKLSRQEFTDNVLPECAQLYKRMHNAKFMMSKSQTK